MAGAQAEARFENIVAPGIDAGEILSGEIFLVHIDAGEQEPWWRSNRA
jgi:hypothetical protein